MTDSSNNRINSCFSIPLHFRYINKLTILTAIMLSTACTDRDHSNPLDPKNRNTEGRPSGLTALSVRDTVFLSWDFIELADIIGYNVYRRHEMEGDFSVIAPRTILQNQFTDFNVSFHTTYEYRVSAVGEDYESEASAPVETTPGPAFNWVGDNGRGELLKLTDDARYVIQAVGDYSGTTDVEPNPATGDVWIIDRFAAFGNVIRITSGGKIAFSPAQFDSPTDLAIHFASNSAWVANRDPGVVVKLSAQGDPILSRTIDSPNRVAVDQLTGDCWVLADEGRALVKILASNSQTVNAPFKATGMIDIAVEQRNGSVWVAATDSVFRLDWSGAFAEQVGGAFADAGRIALNSVNGDLWILDWPATLVKITQDGAKTRMPIELSWPFDISVNIFDNSCLVADTFNDRVLKVSSVGTILSRFVVDRPVALGVQN